MKIQVRHVDRSVDDKILRWLALRAKGVPSGRIAEMDGSTERVVSQATGWVRDHDLQFSGEPVEQVKAAYHWPRGGRR